MDQIESEYDKEKFSERLAKLTGGVAIVRVGAATEADMKQKKGRVEDALHATRAAVAEGILPGGGVALIRVIPAVLSSAKKLEGDEKLGAEIIARALEKPIRSIAENSGEDGAVVADEVRQRGENRIMERMAVGFARQRERNAERTLASVLDRAFQLLNGARRIRQWFARRWIMKAAAAAMSVASPARRLMRPVSASTEAKATTSAKAVSGAR